MAAPNVSVELKPSDELKELFERVPAGLSERLAEIERVLIEICEREGIAFNVEQLSRERLLRNLKDK